MAALAKPPLAAGHATGDNLQGRPAVGVRTEMVRIMAFSLNGGMAAWLESCLPRRLASFPIKPARGWK